MGGRAAACSCAKRLPTRSGRPGAKLAICRAAETGGHHGGDPGPGHAADVAAAAPEIVAVTARPGPNVSCSAASSPGAPAVGTCSQPPSQDAPTSTQGTLGTLLMRYPSQTCVPLAPQRRNSLKVPSCGTGKTIASWAAGRMGLAALASWPAEHGPGPHASRVRARPRAQKWKFWHDLQSVSARTAAGKYSICAAERMDIGHGPDRCVPADWLVLMAASV
jgi:hypothetical protein